jgi:hypothetical protein
VAFRELSPDVAHLLDKLLVKDGKKTQRYCECLEKSRGRRGPWNEKELGATPNSQ